MNEYNAQKAAEEKILNDQKLLDKILHTGIKAEPLKEYDGPYNPIKLKFPPLFFSMHGMQHLDKPPQ